MKPVNTAIIGQGRSGRDIHGAWLKQAKGLYRIVAVADPIAERRERAEREYGCVSVADYRALLHMEGIDLVVNAAPSHLHVPITMDLLENGFHVLCEKPLARRKEEVSLLIALSRKKGKCLAVFQQSRYAPYYRKIREIIDSGVLGRIVQISIAFNGYSRRWDWQTLKEYHGGNLLNTGPHPLDQALQLFGEGSLPDIACVMDRANTFGDAEDHVKILLSGSGHPVIDLEISSCCAYPCYTYLVHGTRGGLKGSTERLDWKYYVPEEAPVQRLTREPLRKADGTPAYCAETLVWHHGSWDAPDAGKPLFDQMAESYYHMLHKTLTEGAPLEVTPEQVLRQIAVIEECHRQNPSSEDI
jgi:predicted dehydrogenase